MMLSSSSKSSSKSSSSSFRSSALSNVVASVDRVLSDRHVSGTATACMRDMLSTIGSGPHGSTAATASNFAMLSSALGIIDGTDTDADSDVATLLFVLVSRTLFVALLLALNAVILLLLLALFSLLLLLRLMDEADDVVTIVAVTFASLNCCCVMVADTEIDVSTLDDVPDDDSVTLSVATDEVDSASVDNRLVFDGVQSA